MTIPDTITELVLKTAQFTLIFAGQGPRAGTTQATSTKV